MTAHALLASTAALLTTAWLAGLWQGAFLVLSGSLLLRLMPGAPARLRHSLLMMLFLVSAVLPWIPLHRTGASAASPVVHLSLGIAYALTALWGAGTMYRLSSLVLAALHLRSVRQRATPLVFDLDRLALSSSRRPAVCVSADVDSPLIIGFFRPVMLLPEWLVPALSQQELDQIAVHECEHLRRRDDWTNLALQLGLTLFPLNPALLWLNQRIAVQRELACDAAVAAVSHPVDYAASLARIAEHRLRRSQLRFALAALGRKSELAHRVQVLLQGPGTWSGMQKASAAAATGIVLAASASVLAHAPQLVSVDSPAPVTMASTSTHHAALPTSPATRTLPLSDGPIAQFVQASYVSPAVSRGRRVAMRKRLGSRRHEDFDVSAAAPVAETSAFRMTSASADLGGAPLARRAVAAVQVFPAFYAPAYVAVPVNDGWLIIQI